jgi:hypothetical protein
MSEHQADATAKPAARRGIIRVAKEMRRLARACLPPDHVIKATQDDLHGRAEAWLIEGPLLPLVAAGAEPDEIQMLLSTRVLDERCLSLVGSFHAWSTSCAASATWEIGSWDVDGFMAWLDAHREVVSPIACADLDHQWDHA